MKLLNGKELAGFIKERQAKQVRGLRQTHGTLPKLAIVQCKDDPVINTYVRLKKAYGTDIQVEVDVHIVAQEEIAKLLQKLNADNLVHGIIVQLPLTDTSQTDEIVNLVAPWKDVDALGNPESPWSYDNFPEPAYLDAAQKSRGTKRASRANGTESERQMPADTAMRGSWFDPATPMAIMWLLSGYNIDLAGKHILLVGKGRLVGAPLERMLKDSGYHVDVIDRSAKDLSAYTKEADIIITATGSPAILYPDMIKQGAVVVDAGVASEAGKTIGDLAPKVYDREDLTITPARGGVGPLTVCALFENVIRAAHRQGVIK